MEIIERQGFDKTIIDSCKVKDDGTYEFKMKVDKPGCLHAGLSEVAILYNFGQRTKIWRLIFRGEDTARIEIKNPPYVYIKGGPNNEVDEPDELEWISGDTS